MRLDWSDFHVVLAIAEQGSVAKACKPLQMTHSTLLRKLDLIETRLQTRLFECTRGRYTLTPADHEIEQAAKAFQPIALAAETRATGQDLRPSGEERVSVAPFLVQCLLPDVMAQFASSFPDVQIELTTSRDYTSIRRREADVAIRVADEVPEWLIGRRLADLEFKIYGKRIGKSKLALRSIDQLTSERRWIGFERDVHDLKFDRWLAVDVANKQVVLRVDNFSHALTMVKAGLGIALLPAFLEGYEPNIQPLSGPIKELTTALWLITHPEIKNTTRIKVLMRAFAPALANVLQRATNRSSATAT